MSNNILQQEEIKEFENLDLLARQVVEGFIIGLHKSPFHGFSVEFAEHRIYNEGESTKNVDWKVFARTDKMYTKKYEEETNLRCHFILDTSSSMYFPKDVAKNKMQFSVLAIASMIELLKRQRDAFGLSLFDESVHTHTISKSSIVHKNLLYNYLLNTLNKNQQKKTNAIKCLHEIAENIHKRSMVVIFSDMFDNESIDSTHQEKLFEALQHLKFNKHEILFFHVVDKKHEVDFEFENRPYLFVDMESGSELKLNASQVKSHYLEKMSNYKKALKLRCQQYKINYIEAPIDNGFKQILMPYLMKRSKMK